MYNPYNICLTSADKKSSSEPKRIQTESGCFRGFQGVEEGFRGFQGVSGGGRGSQRVSGGGRGAGF